MKKSCYYNVILLISKEYVCTKYRIGIMYIEFENNIMLQSIIVNHQIDPL